MKMRAAIAALVGGSLLVGCGSGDTTESAQDTAPKTSEPSKAETKPENDDCLKVPVALGKGIAAGAVEGSGVKYVSASAVKSEDHGKLYYIAMRFTAPGIDQEDGVWASNSLKAGGGLILSVDGLAKEFTVWPDGGTTDAATSAADPGAEKALDCL